MNTPLVPPRLTPPLKAKFHKPSTATPESEQVRILNAMRRDRVLVSITLFTGQALVGRIQSFDQYSLVLVPPSGSSNELLIYKHGVISIARKTQPPAAGASA